MSATALKYVLWLAPALMQLALLVFMNRRKLSGDFPFFFNYTVFQVLSACVLFAVYRWSDHLYFFAYWTSSAISIFLGFAVIYEVFAYSLKPYAGLRDLGTLLFRWAAMLLVLISGITAAASTSGTEMHRLTFAIMSIERSVRLMQCGLLVFVLLCSSYLGLSLRNFACGIAFGFGIFAATDLTILNFRTQLASNHWHGLLSLISSGVYTLSVAAWLSYSLQPQGRRLATGFVYRPLFDRWNQAAMLVVGTAAPALAGNTYLSEIEQTVNNVLAENASRQQLVH
jgi:hypothetical protein